jgi:methionine--tRNA ligase beta chain
MKPEVTIDDFAKLDLRVGLVKQAERKEGSEKLIRLTVDFGEEGTRTIFTALYPLFEPEEFVNKQFIFVFNLAPRKMMDEISQGMIMAAEGPEGTRPVPLVPSVETIPGSPIR